MFYGFIYGISNSAMGFLAKATILRRVFRPKCRQIYGNLSFNSLTYTWSLETLFERLIRHFDSLLQYFLYRGFVSPILHNPQFLEPSEQYDGGQRFIISPQGTFLHDLYILQVFLFDFIGIYII
jgi:hypothetical protein